MPETIETARSGGRRSFTSEVSTWRVGDPIPAHRVNLGTMLAIVKHTVGIVTTIHALRNLGVSKQIVNRTLYLDPQEVLDRYREKFAEAPIIMSGRKRAAPGAAKRPRKASR